jgi:hypothetical protein
MYLTENYSRRHFFPNVLIGKEIALSKSGISYQR